MKSNKTRTASSEKSRLPSSTWLESNSKTFYFKQLFFLIFKYRQQSNFFPKASFKEQHFITFLSAIENVMMWWKENKNVGKKTLSILSHFIFVALFPPLTEFPFVIQYGRVSTRDKIAFRIYVWSNNNI